MIVDTVGEPARYEFGGLLASSPALGKIYSLLGKLAGTSTPILIEGDTGSGKQRLAWAVHESSSARRVTCIRCTGLTESEFRLQVERPQGGKPGRGQLESLILLDVAALCPESQALLIGRLGPDVTFQRGAVKALPGPRIISTSAVDLGSRVHRGRFRADLFYRLNGAVVKIPPLRHRPEDIALLTRSFLWERQPLKLMTQEAERLLLAYSWPGNVRQLLQVLEAAATDAPDQTITEKSLTRFMTGVVPTSDIMVPLGTKLAEAERLVIEATLAAHGANKQETANALGIARRTLYEKLRACRGIATGHRRRSSEEPAVRGEKGEQRCAQEP